MRLLLISIIGLLTMWIPETGYALSEHVLDLRIGQEAQWWQSEPEGVLYKETNGLRIMSERPAFFVRPIQPEYYSIDVITFTYSSAQQFSAEIIWRNTNTDPNIFHRSPVHLPASPQASTFAFNTDTVLNWNKKPEFIGVSFPQGGHIILHTVELHRYSMWEHIGNAIKTVWVMDTFKPYTINVLWGPQWFSLPYSQEILFSPNFPPPLKSVNSILYWILGMGCLLYCSTLRGPLRAHKTKACTALGIVLCTCWLLYDVRMGSEIISYALNDYNQYIRKEESRRTFRDRGKFDYFIKESIQYLNPTKPERYMLVLPRNWPYFGNARYLTYPHNPVDPRSEEQPGTTWVVYKDESVQIDEDGRLTRDDTILSKPGKIVYQPHPSMFVFKTSP